MEFPEYISRPEVKQAEIAADLGCDPTLVSHMAAKRRPFSMDMAIRLFRKRGVKIGPISDATDAQIDTLEQFSGRAAS